MSRLTDEPPQQTLRRHYTFDLATRGEGAIDLSPQGVNAYPNEVTFDDAVERTFETFSSSSAIHAFTFGDSGEYLYWVDGTETIHEYDLTSNWDIGDGTETATHDASSELSVVESIDFNSDGTRMILTGNGTAYQYTLSTAWDLSTASYDSVSENIAGGNTDQVGAAFADGGTRLYVTRSHGAAVNYYQYTLGTAYDITTLSLEDSVAAPDNTERVDISGISMAMDGNEMYVVVDTQPYRVLRFILETPYDISTASYENDYLFPSGNHTTPSDIYINEDRFGYGSFWVGDAIDDLVRTYSFPENLRVDFGQVGRTDGVVGSGADFRESELYIGDLSDGIDQISFSFWIRTPEDLDQRSATDEKQTLFMQLGVNRIDVVTVEEDHTIAFHKPGGGGTTTSSESIPVDEWTHVIVEYDRPTRTIYFDNEVVAEETVADNPITLNETTIGRAGAGVNSTTIQLDDVRIYFSALTEQHREALGNIGREHQSTRTIADAWASTAMPFRGGNRQFASTLAEGHDWLVRTMDTMLQARHINSSAGRQLNLIGRGIGVPRKDGEGDEKYRTRIKAEIAAGRSSGTFQDIIQAASTVVETDTESLELRYVSPATCRILVPNDVLDDSPLTTTEITNILKDVVIAGHDIEVVESVTNPFTLKEAGTGDDANLGLVSDSDDTGGKLVSFA